MRILNVEGDARRRILSSVTSLTFGHLRPLRLSAGHRVIFRKTRIAELAQKLVEGGG
jgi:hypothetical protein